jgi:hypothetical protein
MENNEMKTTVEILDEALQVSDDTLDIVGTDDVEMYEEQEEAETAVDVDKDKFEIHLASGTSLEMQYDDMNWEEVWMNNGATMGNNVLAIMAKARDMRSAADQTRPAIADEIISLVTNAFKEMGVPQLDYSRFIFETKTEEALMYMEDYVRLVSELLHIAQLEVISKPTSGMTISQLVQEFSQQVDEISHNK